MLIKTVGVKTGFTSQFALGSHRIGILSFSVESTDGSDYGAAIADICNGSVENDYNAFGGQSQPC